jgi:hypothetical protein
MKIDWVTVSSLATAAGTLVLAVATFAAVRSANRAARAAELAFQVGLRPLLMPSRLDDAPQKVNFADGKWIMTPGGSGVAEAGDDVVYFTLSLRNVGRGLAVLHGWRFYPDMHLSGGSEHPPPEEFRRLSRDLYVPVADIGFWQGALRGSTEPDFVSARGAAESRLPVTIDLLYGDHEGGQRVISRFTLLPRGDGGGWIATAARHWNVDRPDPR